jgi:hypothetical protein
VLSNLGIGGSGGGSSAAPPKKVEKVEQQKEPKEVFNSVLFTLVIIKFQC